MCAARCIRECSVRWSEEAVEAKWQSALVLRQVSEFEIAGFTGRQGIKAGNRPAIVLDQAEHSTIRNARAINGCRRLIHVQGQSTREVTISGTQVPTGAAPVTLETSALRRAVRVDDRQ